MNATALTDRQRRELEYHRERATTHQIPPIDFGCLTGRRWWNAHWEMYWELRKRPQALGRVLVVGCGFGVDAVLVAKLGGEVHGFDLSPESLVRARELAEHHGVRIEFRVMPAESLDYPDGYFDCIVMRDILHHVDVPKTLGELRRVSAPDAAWVVNEIYSHSFTDRIRHSRLVERVLYPAMRTFIYGKGTPYITEDERKMTERDLGEVKRLLKLKTERYFNAVVTRLLPDRWPLANKADQTMLRAIGPIGRFLGGRALLLGRVI